MADSTPLPVAQVGRTGLTVSRLGFGCVPLGNYPSDLSDAEAAASLDCAWQQGVRYYDVAPLYGHGLAEHRLGAALRTRARREFVVSTKVGRLLKAETSQAPTGDQSAGIFTNPLPFSLVNDYSYDGIMRSVEDSLQRLGLASLDILHIHNIDPANHEPAKLEVMFRQCMAEGYRALEQLRAEGTVKALGVGNNSLAMCQRFAAAGDFDCFMMAGHFNLLDQAAAQTFMPDCLRRGSSILLGSPFASGLLVAEEPEKSLYMYQPPTTEVLQRLSQIRHVCDDHGVSAVAAALHYCLSHPAVTCVVPGMRTVQEVEGCLHAFHETVPQSLFDDLRMAGLTHESTTVMESN